MQEVGFCIAKVWFLFFECCVVAICLECYHNPFAAKWQSVRRRRGPIYRARVYENTHKMTNGNVRALK